MKSKMIKIMLIQMFIIGFKSYGQANDYLYYNLSTGFNDNVRCLAVFNNELYAGGDFTTAGGVSASHIAKWNGSAWTAVGTGLNNNYATSMIVFNGELYVGGNFTTAGGISANRIAKWNGSTWSAVGTGLNGGANSMAIYNNALYVSGAFSIAGGVSAQAIAKWNGSSWSALGVGLNNSANAMCVYKNKLFVAGNFTTAGGVSANYMARWDGTAWSPWVTGLNAQVNTLTVYNNLLYVGGNFTTAGTQIFFPGHLAYWDTTVWSNTGLGLNNFAYSMTGYENSLYIGGNFTTAVVSANRIAKWNGSSMSAIGAGLNSGTVNAMAVNNGVLYAGGTFAIGGGGLSLMNITMIKYIPEPTLASNNIQFTNVTASSLSLNWNNGNGSKHLIVAKAAISGGANAMDKISYTANSSFGTGTDLGNGNYAVYSGTGNSVTVTNLNPDVIYHFSIYEYNDSTASGFTNYLTSSVPTASHTTLTLEPTLNASNLKFTNRTSTSFQVSFTPGNGTKRIVVAREGSVVNGIPTDTLSYSANSSFGNGATLTSGNFVVYNGTGSTFTLSNLTARKNYYFAIYEYNGTTIPANNYLTNNPAIGIGATIQNRPTIASTNIQFTSVTSNSLSFSWTIGNGAKHLVLAHAVSAIGLGPNDTVTFNANNNFAAGSNLGFQTYVVYNGTGNSVTVTNLNPSTIYHFNVYEFNDSSATGYESYLQTTWATAFHTTIAIEPTLNASNFVFSSRTINSMKVSFTVGNGAKRLVVAKKGSAVDVFPSDTINYIASNNFAGGANLGNGNYAVYNGNASSFTITGLIAGTSWYFAVFEYNGSTEPVYNYLTNTPGTSMDATIQQEPTTATTIVQFNIVTSNTLSLTWNNGNGSKHLVVQKSGSPVSKIPVDTMTYSANNNFGMGSDLGGGNFVVYAGAGNAISITNLNPDVIYHFAIFELNDSLVTGYENYLTSEFATTSHTTIATEPTSNTNKISFIPQFTDMLVNLTPGNGSKRIVIAKQGSAVSKAPADTFNYPANSIFASAGTDMGNGNYMVYAGVGNSFNLTGLTANTIYHFASYEYNGSTPAANNYLLANAAISYQSTLTTEPTKADTIILFTNVKDSSMTLSWTVGNGQRRMVLAATSAVTTFPTDGVDHLVNDTFSKGADLGFGNYVVYSGTSNTCNIKGLTPNTTYHFAIYEYNGTNTSNNYLSVNPATASKSTLIAEPLIAATNVTLSPITNGITTVNWTNGNGDSRIVVARQGTPINILPEDGKSYTANAIFGSGNDLGQGNFVCYTGSNNTFNLQGLDPNNLYYIGVIEYNGSGGGSNYKLDLFPIADNLPAEPTTMPTNMTFSDITNSSVKVSWTKGNGTYRVLIAKDGSAVNKKPVDGTVYVANSSYGTGADLGLANFVVYNGVGNTATITNLSDKSTYHFALFEFNKDVSGPANYANNSLNASVEIGSSQGLEDAANKLSQFQLYPNPSTGNFTFENKSSENYEVQVFDIKGRLIDCFVTRANTNQSLDYNMLQSGLYLIHVKSETGIKNLKLIIEK